MRDVILALGCSFTDPNFRAGNVPSEFPEHLRGGWKMWPEIFTDRLSERDGKKYKLSYKQSRAYTDYLFESTKNNTGIMHKGNNVRIQDRYGKVNYTENNLIKKIDKNL